MLSFSPLLSDIVSVAVRNLGSDRTAVLIRPFGQSPATSEPTTQNNSGDVSLVKIEVNISSR